MQIIFKKKQFFNKSLPTLKQIDQSKSETDVKTVLYDEENGSGKRNIKRKFLRTAICILNALTYGTIDHDVHIFRERH